MQNAYRLTLNAPYQTVIMMVDVKTLAPICAQIPSNKLLQVFDTSTPDKPLADISIEQFATNLGLVISKPTSPMPKADYDRLKSTALRFWEAREGTAEGTRPKGQTGAPKSPVANPDQPTWSTRTRSAEVQVETVTKPYTHIKEPAPFKRDQPKSQRGPQPQVTIILVPANKGDGRVVFDHLSWMFKPGPPVPGTSKAEQGLKAILRDEWAAKKLNAALADVQTLVTAEPA